MYILKPLNIAALLALTVAAHVLLCAATVLQLCCWAHIWGGSAVGSLLHGMASPVFVLNAPASW